MEFRQLGGSGFKVPALSLGTGTFGGSNDFFRAWGDTDAKGATRLIDICLEAGVNITVGLPVIRTSVDHGTAFDIAGTGQADERSLLEALRQAIALAPARREN